MVRFLRETSRRLGEMQGLSGTTSLLVREKSRRLGEMPRLLGEMPLPPGELGRLLAETPRSLGATSHILAATPRFPEAPSRIAGEKANATRERPIFTMSEVRRQRSDGAGTTNGYRFQSPRRDERSTVIDRRYN